MAELSIVMSVFPLPATLAAVQVLVGAILGANSPNRLPNLYSGHYPAGFVILLIETVLPLAAAALVLYLLSNPAGPDDGPRSIGLSRDLYRADLALLMPVFLLAFVVPMIGVGVVLAHLHVKGVHIGNGHVPTYYVVIDVVAGVVAGIVEEIVVLGYLVRRLEQLGLSSFAVVVIAVAVRGSYHLYYGWGVLPILAWATASVVLYRRWRRLAPFMAVHALWDVGLFLAQWFGYRVLGWEFLLLVVPTTTFFFLWKGFIPRPLGKPPMAQPRPG
jgi:membrane protease YdiL (CAAX protease family)